VGGSRKMQEVYSTVERVAPTRSTVMIRGESGTGKELIARALHYNSPRAGAAFIRVSCAALPLTLLESELFGHERGAFTGATEQRRGRFELADHGTLFLDEIGDIDAATQVKLLRVLQERKFERLGGSRTISVDVRLVAATNRDLEKAVREGGFREDLYYRLNVIPLFLPPLREREGDVLLLVEHFLARFNAEHSKSITFSRAALRQMLRYPWPGNVRELENALERLVVLAQGDLVDEDDLPLAIRSDLPVSSHTGPLADGARLGAPRGGEGGEAQSLPETVRGMEKERILRTLRESSGIQTKAAKAMGLTVRQLGYKLKKYGITLRVPQEG
jgi:Nif-specific regulatory protein